MSTETTPLTPVEALVEEMKAPAKFSFADAINQVSHPTGKVDVFLDGARAGRLFEIDEEITEHTTDIARLRAKDSGGITDVPEVGVLEDAIKTLEAEQVELITSIRASRVIFHVRGVVPAVWRVLDKKVRREVKAASKAEIDEVDANIERNNLVNKYLVQHGVTKIENAEGAVDESGLDLASVETLFDTLAESEWEKLKDKVQELTFASRLFAKASEQDADFLPQP